MDSIFFTPRADRFPSMQVKLVEQLFASKNVWWARFFLIFCMLFNNHAHFSYLFAVSLQRSNTNLCRFFATRAIKRNRDFALLKTYEDFLRDLPINNCPLVLILPKSYDLGSKWVFPKRNIATIKLDRNFNNSQREQLEEFLVKNPKLEDLGAWSANLFLPARGKLLSTNSLLRHQVGSEGIRRPSIKDITNYINFIASETQSLNLEHLIEVVCSNPNISLADLGTVVDLILISRFQKEPLSILEIGGGYGRLAEGLIANINLFESQKLVKYVLVDAIPESISSSCAYLDILSQQNLVDIIPVWDSSWMQLKYNLIINIESFQEMSDSWIDYYSYNIDRVSVPGTILYLSNTTSHFNPRGYSPTEKWKQVETFISPRHWTSKHVTSVYKKIV